MTAPHDPAARSTASLNRDAYQRVRPALAALPRDRIRPLTVDPDHAIVCGYIALQNIAERQIGGAIVALGSVVDQAPIAALEDHTRAFAHANATYRVGSDDDDLAVTKQEAITLRRTILADLRSLAGHGVQTQMNLNKVSVDTSYRGLAGDLVGISIGVRRLLSTIEGKTAITVAQLDRADQLAEDLKNGLVARADRSQTAQDMRDRAYTLFDRSYDELRRAITVLRWHDGDAAKIIPPLSTGRGKRKRRDKTVPAAPVETPPGNASSAVDHPNEAAFSTK